MTLDYGIPRRCSIWAYEYQTFGGYSSCDDMIAEFTAGPLVHGPDTRGLGSDAVSHGGVGRKPDDSEHLDAERPGAQRRAVVSLTNNNAAAVIPATVTVTGGNYGTACIHHHEPRL